LFFQAYKFLKNIYLTNDDILIGFKQLDKIEDDDIDIRNHILKHLPKQIVLLPI